MKLNIIELVIGIRKRLDIIFYRPFSKFDISWFQEKLLKHANSGIEYSHLYKNRYKIIFKDPKAFLYSVKELFVEEIYKFKAQNDTPYIIDCGSYIGTSILFFKTQYPNSKILAFEPDNSNFELLNKNIKNWDLKNIEIQNAAIWIDNLGVNFIADGNMASKIDESNNTDHNENQKTKSVRLKDLLTEKIDFLKIDIEGAEYEVLLDCESKLSFVENLFIEYHGNYNEMYKLNKILNILIENNFKYYIKEAGVTFEHPFYDRENIYDFNIQLNIFAFKN
jgi:FkbM family methyltransferase